MEWKLLATTFATIFLAELGDKTQLAAMALAAGTSSKWAVFVGASLALLAATAVAVLAGDFISHYLPQRWIKRGAGALFVVIGLVLLLTSGQTTNQKASVESTTSTH